MQLSPFCSWSCQSSVWHLPYVFRRKFTGFLSSCSLLYPCERVMLLLSAEASFKPGGPSFWEFASKHLPQRLIFGRPFLTRKGCGYPIFCTELSVGIIGIYGIGSHTSYPYIHQLLLHTEKDVSGNPVYIGVKHRTRYGSHPFDWGVFQEAWSYGA